MYTKFCSKTCNNLVCINEVDEISFSYKYKVTFLLKFLNSFKLTLKIENHPTVT